MSVHFTRALNYSSRIEVILHGNDSLGCEKLPSLNNMHLLSFKLLRNKEWSVVPKGLNIMRIGSLKVLTRAQIVS